jgi:hypothetical protein
MLVGTVVSGDELGPSSIAAIHPVHLARWLSRMCCRPVYLQMKIQAYKFEADKS